jgi:ribonuclease P protein component
MLLSHSCLEHTIQRKQNERSLTDFWLAKALGPAETLSSAVGQKADTSLPSKVMLPRKRRVTSTLFQEVMDKGRSFHSPHLSAKVLFKDNVGTGHLSAVVPKKVAAKATVRNNFRRRIYAIVRMFENRLPIQSAALIFVKKNISKLSIEELKEELRTLLAKAFVIEL